MSYEELKRAVELLPDRSPVEYQIDTYGETIGISRQWYEEACDIIEDLRKMLEERLLVERYFVKEETNPMSVYPWLVGENIADHNTFGVVMQCKTKEDAEKKLKELYQ